MSNQTMPANDAISGARAECYMTIQGNRYNFMQLFDFSSEYELNIAEVPILGQQNKGHKPVGGQGQLVGNRPLQPVGAAGAGLPVPDHRGDALL